LIHVPRYANRPRSPRLRARAIERLTAGKCQYMRLGGCCCPGGCTTTICCVSPCVAPDGASGFGASNVTVTVSNGSGTIFEGVTPSGGGCVTFTIPSAAAYTVTTTGNNRYNNTTQVIALNCGAIQKIILTAAGGFTCGCLANEPISNNLVITGGTGSATIPSNVSIQFTLPCSVPLLTPGDPGNCSGDVTENPCETGTGTLTVQFTFDATSGCNDIQQGTWTVATPCTVNLSDDECPPFSDEAYPFYIAIQSTGEADQWGTPDDCMGYCSITDSVDPLFTVPQTVPLNFTVTFTGLGGTPPPIASVTVTEEL
jgi:hypothetical protein